MAPFSDPVSGNRRARPVSDRTNLREARTCRRQLGARGLFGAEPIAHDERDLCDDARSIGCHELALGGADDTPPPARGLCAVAGCGGPESIEIARIVRREDHSGLAVECVVHERAGYASAREAATEFVAVTRGGTGQALSDVVCVQPGRSGRLSDANRPTLSVRRETLWDGRDGCSAPFGGSELARKTSKAPLQHNSHPHSVKAYFCVPTVGEGCPKAATIHNPAQVQRFWPTLRWPSPCSGCRHAALTRCKRLEGSFMNDPTRGSGRLHPRDQAARAQASRASG